MTNRSNLEKLNTSIKKIDDSINQSVEDMSKLQIESEEILIQIIKDEKLLKNSIWDIEYVHEHIYLNYAGDRYDIVMGQISNLCSGSYHSWLNLENGIQLRLDEEKVSLHFDEAKTILPFANKHQIKITGNNVSDKLQKLKRESSALEQLIHQFSIK